MTAGVGRRAVGLWSQEAVRLRGTHWEPSEPSQPAVKGEPTVSSPDARCSCMRVPKLVSERAGGGLVGEVSVAGVARGLFRLLCFVLGFCGFSQCWCFGCI